jgi:hypothetical protein
MSPQIKEFIKTPEGKKKLARAMWQSYILRFIPKEIKETMVL